MKNSSLGRLLDFHKNRLLEEGDWALPLCILWLRDEGRELQYRLDPSAGYGLNSLPLANRTSPSFRSHNWRTTYSNNKKRNSSSTDYSHFSTYIPVLSLFAKLLVTSRFSNESVFFKSRTTDRKRTGTFQLLKSAVTCVISFPIDDRGTICSK